MTLRRLLELDALWSKRFKITETPGFTRRLASFLAHSGDSWFWIVGLAILWYFGNPEWQFRALFFNFCVVVTAVLVMGIKFSVRRQRPVGDWGGIYRKTDPHSFPSGHAARSFLLMTLAIGLGPAWLAVLLTVWAPLVGLARVSMGVHYLSDIIVGMLIGILLGVIFLQGAGLFGEVLAILSV